MGFIMKGRFHYTMDEENKIIKPPVQHVISPYTRNQFESFKKRFAQSMLNKGLDCLTLQENNDYANFVVSYVQKEVIDKEEELKKDRITRKMSYMSLENKTFGVIQYPVILEYKGHDLINGYAFGLDEFDRIEVRVIPMLKGSALIIP